MKQKKVLLLGSYGQSNLGDDLLMWNYLALLKKRGYQEIHVNANTTELIPQAIKKAFPELHIHLTYKTSPLAYIRLIRHVDCIVYGGGTLYKELYASTGRSPRSVILRLMVFNLLARALGARLYHLNIGIGSLKTRRGRLITKLALQAATVSVFRDGQSYRFASTTLRVPPAKIQRSTDGLFLNDIWKTPWHEDRLVTKQKGRSRTIGINVLSDIPDWVNREHYVATLQQFVETILKQGDFVVLIPFQTAFNPRNDLAFMQDTFSGILEKYDNHQLLRDVPIDRVHSYLSQCDLFVGMRFHSLLLSTVCKVPFIALAYDTKCWRFIEETDYPFALKIEDMTNGKLMALYEKATRHDAKIRGKLEGISEKTYNEAEDSLRTIAL